MSYEDLLYFAEYAADHINAWGAWPVDFENTDTGQVWELDECMKKLSRFPALYAVLVTALELKND